VPVVTLGIETSGRSGRIALCVDGENLDERELSQAGRRHAQTLVLEIRDLLTDHSLAPADLDLVAVSEGPGSFTGLRVGVVCAKMLAWANGADLVMIDTLLAIAAESPQEVCRVEIVSDAQRDDLFLGVYEGTDSEKCRVWSRSGSVEIVNSEAWALSLASRNGDGFAIAGPGVEKAAEFLPDGIRQLDRSSAEPSAATIARLGELLAKDGQLADPMTVEPFYLRKSAAEEKRDAAKSGS
jgi:tRNA threonylcarbamoyladenosine biosynthesis protein TsaB